MKQNPARPKCSKCIHKYVCTDSLLRLTLYEYGECRHFIDEDKIIIKTNDE